MSWLWRFLGRFPRTMTGLIAAAFAAGLWAATDYVKNVVEPREAAARQARVEREIARADALFDRGKYETAIAEYDYAIRTFAAELAPAEIARLHNRAGLAHAGLADSKSESAEAAAAQLERALEAFSRALEIRSAAADTPGELATRLHMGDAWRALARARGDAGALDGAVQAYRAALELAGETGSPARAAAFRALGNAWRDRFELARDRAALETAFAAYDEAMRAADPARHPVARGETLIEIGLAWVQEAENGYRKRNLIKAVETLEDAKAFLTLEIAPAARARLHLHIGDTYLLLARTPLPRRSERARHQQDVVRWQNRAELAYKVARSFGYRPAQANLVPGNPAAARAAAAAGDDEKKE